MVPGGVYYGTIAGCVNVEMIVAVHRGRTSVELVAMVLRGMLRWSLSCPFSELPVVQASGGSRVARVAEPPRLVTKQMRS